MMNSLRSSAQKSIWTELAILFVLALIIRTLAALPQQQPNYMDAAYSYVNAVNLAEGKGFVEDFIWNYLGEPKLPPQPSHLYWMPLTSILAWSGMVIGGVSYRAAQIPFIVLSALLAPISYWIACTLTGQRWLSWLAGLFAIFNGFYFPFWTAIDNFTPFAIAGSLALLFAWRGLAEGGDWRLGIRDWKEGRMTNDNGHRTANKKHTGFLYLTLAGVFVGLAHLARADGPLMFIAVISVYPLHLIVSARRPSSVVRPITNYVLRFTFYLALGYTLMMLPWLIRNWQVIGTLLPTTGSQTIWLTSYDDLFSYNRQFSAQTLFAQGLGLVLQGRWWAFTTNLQTVVAVWGMIFLAPLALIGGWQLRHQLFIQMVATYALLLFIAMTLIFAFPGTRGGLFHSGAALLPFIYGLAMVGLDRAIDWAAARRRGWDARIAKQVFGVGLLVIAIALSGFIYYQRVLKNNTWNTADRFYPAIATWLAEHEPAGIVMVGNPPAYRYHGGGLSVVVPSENIETTLQAAQHYQVDYLVLDSNHPAPLAELYQNPTHNPALSLVQTFGEGTGNEIYLFEIVR